MTYYNTTIILCLNTIIICLLGLAYFTCYWCLQLVQGNNPYTLVVLAVTIALLVGEFLGAKFAFKLSLGFYGFYKD